MPGLKWEFGVNEVPNVHIGSGDFSTRRHALDGIPVQRLKSLLPFFKIFCYHILALGVLGIVRHWKPQQRIVFFVALGWVVFSIFSKVLFRIYLFQLYGANSLQYYMNSGSLADFPHSYVVVASMYTLSAMLLAFWVSYSQKPGYKDYSNVLLTLILVLSTCAFIMVHPHSTAVESTCQTINSGLCMVISIVFWRTREHLS